MDQKAGISEQMPTSIGRYQVQESIGFGAMGAVYKAFDPLIKRTLAIKTIRLDIPRNSPQYKSFIERFYHEARISGTLSHPNIVTLFDIGEEGGVPYLAMEFVEGDTLASLVERGVAFPPEKVVSLVSQVASAVDYAHSKGVIHRDLKPSNMILSEGDRLKVTDFGIAKLVDSDMTQSGTLVGTPSYMSPEQAMGEKLDGRSDIFSLGVCAFEMLSGEQPFPGANVTSILYKLVHVDPVEPTSLELHGLVPQKWHEVFGKVLAKKPDERYQTAAEFVADLEFCLGSWFGGVGSETLSESGAVPPPAPAQKAASAKPTAASPVPDEMATAAISAEQVRAAERGQAAQRPAPKPAAPKPPFVSDEPATVLMGAGQLATAMPKTTPPAPASGMQTPVPRLQDETLKAPAPATPLRTSGPDLGTVRSPAPPPKPTRVPQTRTASATIPPLARASARSFSPVALLGVAVVFFLVAVGVAGYVFWKRAAAAAEAEKAPPVVVATPTPAPITVPPASGLIHVETTPPGAAISLNGELKGSSPLDLTGLAIGEYEVRAELKGYEPKAASATILESASQTQVVLVLTRVAPVTGGLEVVSQPPGGDVTVDGARAGSTPIADLRLRPGSHQVAIALEGYEPWSGSVNVEAGKKTRLDAALQATPKATPTPPPAPAVDPTKIYLNTASDVDTLAKKTSGSTASYPSNATRLKSGDSVSVSVTFVVDESGDVTDVKVVESSGAIIDDAVLKAIRKWKYSPAEKQGVKVKVRIAFKQTFRAG